MSMPHLSFEASAVNYVIGLFCFIALAQWLSAYRRLKHIELKQLRRILASPPKDIHQAEALLTTTPSTCVEKALKQALERGAVNIDTLEYDTWIHWPRYWAGIFVFIGLLGTVLGISLAIYSLGSTLDSTANGSLEQLSQLQMGITSLLSNMKAAFICTLCGLIATLIISLLNTRFLSLDKYITSTVLALATESFIPLHFKEKEQREETHRQQVNTSIKYLNTTVEALEKSAHQLSNNISPATEHFASLASHTSTLAHHLSEAATGLKAETNRTADVYNQIDRFLRDCSISLQQQQQSLKESTAAIAAAADTLSNGASSLAVDRDSVNRVGNAVTMATREMVLSARELHEKLLTMEQQQQQSLSQVVERVVNAHELSVKQIQERMIEMQDKQEQHLERLDAMLSSIYEEAMGHLKAMIIDLHKEEEARVARVAHQLVEMLQSQASSMQREFAGVRKQGSADIADLSGRISIMFEKTLDEMKNERDAAEQVQQKFLETFISRATALNQELQNLLYLFERTLVDVSNIAESPSLKHNIAELQNELKRIQRNEDLYQQRQVSAAEHIMQEINQLEVKLRAEIAGYQINGPSPVS